MSTKHITAHNVHEQRRLKQYCEFQLCSLWFQLLQLHNEGDALTLVVMIQLINFHKPFCMDYINHSDIFIIVTINGIATLLGGMLS